MCIALINVGARTHCRIAEDLVDLLFSFLIDTNRMWHLIASEINNLFSIRFVLTDIWEMYLRLDLQRNNHITNESQKSLDISEPGPIWISHSFFIYGFWAFGEQPKKGKLVKRITKENSSDNGMFFSQN